MKVLYGTATGASDIIDIAVTESHSSPSASATVKCLGFSGSIGSNISIDLGYTDNHAVVFTGYVKSIDHEVKDSVYTITASDVLVRANDFFVVPDSPTNVFSRDNISAEDLVSDVLGLAGVTLTDTQPTYFTLAVNGSVAEVKLVSAYDYANSIATIVAWKIWADRSGGIHFRNRKPYPMDGASGQPDDNADSPIAISIDRTNTLEYTYREDASDLRNKVVVWGYNGIAYTASAVSPYLPSGFYKTVLYSNEVISTAAIAKDTANYNLAMLNRLGKELNVTVFGDPLYTARETVMVDLDDADLNNVELYIFSANHIWNSGGYRVNMMLRG